MPEKIRELRNFQLRYICDEALCGTPMSFSGEPPMEVQGSASPLFKHVCPKCKSVKYLAAMYPMNIGLPVNEPIPEKWIPVLDREQVNNPPPEPPKVLAS